LESVFLCQALTQEKLNIRLLGQSKNVETPVNATIFATGNNIIVAGDLTRRTIMCALDARCEHPERRNFNVDVIEFARTERAKLVAAALTILRAWHVAGETIEPPPIGSFEQWSNRIRAPLLWLGQADPCETTLRVQTEDPLLLSLSTVMAQWRDNVGLFESMSKSVG
jgi:putative DNA primase/helicase